MLQYGASPYPSGGTDQEILAWQSTQQVQLAYRAWQLATAQFSPGRISAIAIDQSTCAYRFNSNKYHYYDGTRVPTPNGRSCQNNAYNQDPDPDFDPTGIIERGALDLEEFAAYSNGLVPVVKDFDITLHPLSGTAFDGGIPPNWITRASRRAEPARASWRSRPGAGGIQGLPVEREPGPGGRTSPWRSESRRSAHRSWRPWR